MVRSQYLDTLICLKIPKITRFPDSRVPSVYISSPGDPPVTEIRQTYLGNLLNYITSMIACLPRYLVYDLSA